MKKSVFLISVLLALYLSSCQEVQDALEALKFSVTALTLPGDGVQPTTFELDSQLPWTVLDSPDWLTITPLNGVRGTVTVQVTVSGNSSDTPRNGSITIRAADGSKVSLPVSQGVIFAISANSLDLSGFAHANTVTLTSNYSWTLPNDLSTTYPWISSYTSQGDAGSPLTITCNNNADADQEARLTFTASDGQQATLTFSRSLPLYKIGDYYPDPHVVYTNKVLISGITAIGVVFEVDSDTQIIEDGVAYAAKGKVVSLDEGTGLAWGPDVTTKVASTTDGLANMNTMRTYITDNSKLWTDFPAFNWIFLNKNEDFSSSGSWYLPAKEELSSLCYSTTNFPSINAHLSAAAGGTAITISGSDGWHCSSSEYSTNSAWFVPFGSGYANSNGKNRLSRVRAVLAF